MTEILQILPRVPPAVCGVGDYAWNLAGKLERDHRITSHFLATTGDAQLSPSDQPFKVSRLAKLAADDLVNFVAAAGSRFEVLVLHYSGYGFAPRGAPLWLARALAKIRRLKNRPRIVTMFHELHASGPVSSSAFWLQPLQRLVVRNIARASDVVRTNREEYAARLKAMLAGNSVGVSTLPVFSNLGESASPGPLREREPRMIVFSSSLQGPDHVRQVEDTATALCAKLKLSGLHMVGRHWNARAAAGIEVVRHDFLSVSNAESLLARCQVGFMVYPPRYLGKSTFFAALAAHGLAAITQGVEPVLPDGLHEGVEVLHEETCLRGAAPDLSRMQKAATGLRAWYAP